MVHCKKKDLKIQIVLREMHQMWLHFKRESDLQLKRSIQCKRKSTVTFED